MIRLNLLPYRERQRTAHRRRFRVIFLGMLLSCVITISSSALMLEQQVRRQVDHNQYQENTINALNKQLISRETVRKARAALLEQNDWLKRLEQNRNHAARLLDQFAYSTPAGICLYELKPSSIGYTVSGHARSLGHISAYLQALSTSRVFAHPKLIEFKRPGGINRHESEFIIDMEAAL